MLSAETTLITRSGSRSIGEILYLGGGAEFLTPFGWTPGVVSTDPTQVFVYEVRLVPVEGTESTAQVILATEDHIWPLVEGGWAVELRPGDVVQGLTNQLPVGSSDDERAVKDAAKMASLPWGDTRAEYLRALLREWFDRHGMVDGETATILVPGGEVAVRWYWQHAAAGGWIVTDRQTKSPDLEILTLSCRPKGWRVLSITPVKRPVRAYHCSIPGVQACVTASGILTGC